MKVCLTLHAVLFFTSSFIGTVVSQVSFFNQKMNIGTYPIILHNPRNINWCIPRFILIIYRPSPIIFFFFFFKVIPQ